MNRDAYQHVLHEAHRLRLAARELAAGDLDAAIDAIGRADAVGPILDPTLYRDRHEAMREDEVTLRAVRVLARLGAPEGLAGEGGAAAPRSQNGEVADGAQRRACSSSLVETVAFTGAPAPRRMGPAAS